MDYQELSKRFEAGRSAASTLGLALEKTLRHDDVFGDALGDLEAARGQLTEMLHTLKRQLESPAYRIAAVGGFSGGKSSMLNALLERDLLVENVNPETANVTVIRKAPAGGEETLTLRYMDEAQFRRYSQESCREIGIEYVGDTGRLLEIAEQHRDELKRQLADQFSDARDVGRKVDAVEDLVELLSGYQQNKGLLGRAEKVPLTPAVLRDWTTKTSGHTAGQLALVREVELAVHSDFLDQQTVLVDLPGTDSTRIRDTRIAHDYIREVDAVIVCTFAKRPFSDDDTEVMKILRTQGSGLQNKLFFVLTQLDTLSTKELLQLERTYDDALKTLNASFQLGKPDHFYVASSYASRALRLQASGASVDDELAKALREFGVQSEDLQAGNSADLPANIREMLAVYFQGGGVPALRTALMSHFKERSLQEKMRDTAARLRGIQERLERVVLPRYESIRDRASNAQVRISLSVSAITDDCVRFVNHEVRQRLGNEELAGKVCEAKFNEQVTDRIEAEIKLCIEEIDFRSPYGDSHSDGKALPEQIDRRVRDRFFDLLDRFLDAAAFQPIDRLLTKEPLPRGRSSAEALRMVGEGATLQEIIHKVYRPGSKPVRRFEEAQASFRRTVAVCLRARADEEIRRSSARTTEQDLQDGPSKLVSNCAFRFSRLAGTLCGTARNYIVFCLDLFLDELTELLPAEAYHDEAELPLDMDRLLASGDASEVEVLNQLNAQLGESSEAIDILSP